MREHLNPTDCIRKLRQLAAVDGWLVASVAAASGIVTVVSGYWAEATFCVLAMGVGVVELKTAHTLKTDIDKRHLSRLVTCQVALVALIIVYALWRLSTLKPSDVLQLIDSSPLTSELLSSLGDQKLVESAITLSIRLIYGLLILLALLLQGGLALHYLKSERRILKALQPPPLPHQSQK